MAALLVLQLSAFAALLLVGVAGDMYNDAKVFMVCKGKDSGMKAYYKVKASMVLDCGTTPKKYCKATCAFKHAGVLDEDTGEMDYNEMNRLVDEYGKMDKETKDKLKAVFYKCSSGKKFFVEGKCGKMREMVYCVYNEYIKICNVKKTPKSLQDESPEDDTGVADAALDMVKGGDLPDL